MSYNFLKEARIIRNSDNCFYDSLDGYASDFHINGNVDGWDVYNNIYLYGCWNGTLFGTSYDRNCYISRSNVFPYVEAENYYYINIMMKITDNSPNAVVDSLTTGRIRWTRTTDHVWNSDKQEDFDIIVDNKWHLYSINMGPKQWWQGNIDNLRVYPFIDGRVGDQFAIKFIKISSLSEYVCNNTSCSYYSQYSHPCPGVGSKGTCEAGNSYTKYTTISGISDTLIVNINGYGWETFKLGNNSNLTGIEMSKVISNQISALNIGGYAFATCEYSEEDKLKITSGTTGSMSSVTISGSAAEVLGFCVSGVDVSFEEVGTTPATGFDYASARILTALEINKLADGNSNDFAYIHSPEQYAVEAGRSDFNEIGTSRLLSDIAAGEYYESLNNEGRTLIDFSHPFNNNGRVKAIYMYGVINTMAGASKIKILRPKRDGTLTVVHSLEIPTEEDAYLYTTRPIVVRVDCNVLVERGDLIGIYNANLYVGVTPTGLPEATFSQVSGNVSGNFDPGSLYSYGVGGFAVYARGDRFQTNTILDIDLGDRINIEEINIRGCESVGYYDFNIASCLDVSWEVDLFGGVHHHTGVRWTDGTPFYDTHQNIASGEDALNDCIRTPDNGRQGDSYQVTSNGMVTTGDHAYFYVDGDAEWLYSYECAGKTEYCWPYVPRGVIGFAADPIAFTLEFPFGFSANVNRSIIYFKERNNFRNLALSYYLGQYDASGNADSPYFRYVPEYTSIRLDGLLYEPDDESVVNPYIFNNPMDGEVVYGGPGNTNPTNPDVVEAAHAADWTIIEHNFELVECKGFRIFTNYHNSTKIMEMEVYSRVVTSPSLIDNITLQFSDYGDIWTLASFNERSDGEITAFVGGAPRYFTLELESVTEFTLNEIELFVGDQVKTSDCSDVVLLEHAKSGTTNKSAPVVIENIYDKPFDLYVDLPKEVTETNNLIFWSKLGSYDEIENPEIGPGCKLYKSDDFEIRNDNHQCAINVPAYGLKNIVHNKRAYVCQNNTTWDDFGVLSSGVSIDFCIDQYKETIITLPYTSEKYFKVCLEAITGSDTSLRDVIPMHDDEVLEIDCIYVDSPAGPASQTNLISSDGINITPQLLIRKDMGIKDLPVQNTDITPFALTVCALMTDDLCNGAGGCITGLEYMIGIDLSSPRTIDQLFLDFSAGTATAYNTANPQVRYSNDNLNWTLVTGLTKTTNTLGCCNNRSVLTFDPVTARYFRSWCSYRPYLNEITALYNSVSMNGRSVGFKVKNGFDTVNKIRLIHTTGAVGNVSIYTSNDNLNNYTIRSGVSISQAASNYNMNLAIDLEKRHDLDIIRNYGAITDKLWTSITSNVIYSNSNVDDVYSVVWDNSNYNDARWIRIDLLSGDGVDKCIRKLGIYPDISSVFCKGGDYNCEWHSLGNILSDYDPPLNVAYVATTTGTNYYFFDYYPDNAVNGITTDYSASACWGFQQVDGVDPYIELDFGSVYTINKVVLYHGYDPEDSSFINTDYTFSVSTSMSGSFTSIFSVTDNTQHERIHQFTPVEARRARLTITGYTGDMQIESDPYTGELFIFNGSYLREIEVYTYTDDGYADSETWPIVCMNLQDQFDITGHAVINKDVTDTDTDWDNAEEFFDYSDDIFDDPKKVSFTSAGEYKIQYQKTDASSITAGRTEYIFDSEVYFDEGQYEIEWGAYASADLYSADYPAGSKISLRLEGPDVIDHFTTVDAASTWLNESGNISVPTAGFYTVKGVQHIDATYAWGVRNPLIKRPVGLRKWIAARRDTAENYAYDDDSDKYGKDYLTLLKVYGDIPYNPLEYSWWWSSSISTLSNDYFKVRTNPRSLKISYPSSSGVDTVYFREGDDFGNDVYFDYKDLLQIWLYIDNVSNLDVAYGDITFGIINNNDPVYYMWNISELNFLTGWNNLKLKFEDADYFYPTRSNYDFLSDYIHEDLDFRNTDRDFTSFRLRYRGKGQSFNIYIENIKIMRNVFEEDVKFGKGLCLTGNDFLEIPLSTITLEKGTIEFWVKMYSDTYGRNKFNDFNSRVLFTLVNNNNDIITLGIKSGSWFEPGSGHIRKALNLFDIEDEDLPISSFYDLDDLVHLAVVWSNDGSFIDNGDTMRFYINNELICASKTTWEVGDTKAAILKLGGATTQMALNKDAYGSSIFDSVKVYNYCKTEFDIENEESVKDVTYTPNEFLEISSDGINFYGVGSASLPIVFEGVHAGESRIVYVRASKNDNFRQSRKTATLIIDWLTTV